MANGALNFGSRGLAWKGASTSNETLKAFRVSKGSADRDVSVDREILALRARNLYQNSPFSRALIDTIDTNVVGTGLKARPAILYELLGMDRKTAKKWEKDVRTKFELWACSKLCDAEGECDFHELQSLAFKTQLVTGDVFAVTQYVNDSKSAFGLRIKLLEGDRCRNPFGKFESQKLSQGIEVNENGAAIAYHFTKVPPFNLDNNTDSVETVRIPTFDDFGNVNVIHCFTAARTDQRRGVTILAPIVSDLKHQEGYKDSEVIAARVSAALAVFLESNNPDEAGEMDGNVPEEEKVGGSSGHGSPIELAPGAILELPQGYKANAVNPLRPNVNYKPFVDAIFCEDGASAGVSFELVLKSFRGSNYNSVRAALHESKKTFDRFTHNFVSDFCQRIYEKWLCHAVMTGMVEAEGFFEDPLKRAAWCKCNWIGDSAFLLDPLKETQAIKMQIDEQLVCRDDAIAAINGGDYENIVDRLSEEMNYRGEHNLPEPGAVTKSESVSVSTVDNGEDEED